MTTHPQSRPVFALAVRLLAVMCLTTMAMLVKLAGDHGVHLFEIMFWRQAVTIPLVLSWLGAKRNLRVLKTPRFAAHLRRSLLGVFGMSLMFAAFLLLPLAEATAINFTVPLFATLLSVMFLHEKIGLWRLSALAIGFAGVIIITRPGNSDIPLLGAAAGLGAAFMIAMLSILIKDLNRTDQPVCIVFWFAAIGTPITAIALPFVMTTHDGMVWGLLMAAGIFGSFGQLLLTTALRFGDVSSVVVMDYSGLIWATIYGWIVWDRLPSSTTWLGAPLIITAGMIIVWREHKRVKGARSKSASALTAS
jgi:drug/metabolite transporter (DMT)-like permease